MTPNTNTTPYTKTLKTAATGSVKYHYCMEHVDGQLIDVHMRKASTSPDETRIQAITQLFQWKDKGVHVATREQGM